MATRASPSVVLTSVLALLKNGTSSPALGRSPSSMCSYSAAVISSSTDPKGCMASAPSPSNTASLIALRSA